MATVNDETRIHIRRIISRDLPEVLAIEHASFEHPWCEDEFHNSLRHRNSVGMVAEQGGHVVGFVIYEVCPSCLLVMDFATHPEFRRTGFGRKMVVKLVETLSSHRRPGIVVPVRETNVSGLQFFRSQGFLAVEVVRDFYGDTFESAIIMTYKYDGDLA